MKQKILSYLPGNFPWQVHWFNTIESTNDYAKIVAKQGAPHGTVLVAGMQTKGRGRMGRSFSSPADQGVYLSVILRPNVPAQALLHLTCAAAVAMCDAVENVCKCRPKIKWINDLIMEDRKLGGILTELSVHPKTGLVDYAVIGVGINCTQRQTDFPKELQNSAISLEMATGKTVSRAQLAAAMIDAFAKLDCVLLAQQTALMNAYRKDCITLGRQIVLTRGDEVYSAVALDVENDGALLVEYPDHSTQRIQSGEAQVRGIAGYV